MISFTSSKSRKLLSGVFSSMITIGLCLMVMEILARIFVFDPSQSYIRTPGWSMFIQTDGKLPNVTGNYQIHINSLGIRGDLPTNGTYPKIAVLGGSTVEDWVLNEQETWVKQLQAKVRQKHPEAYAANLGKSGVNARHHLIQLPEVEGYMPQFDTFIVLLGLNDFLYDYRIHHHFKTPEGWWQEQAFMYQSGNEGYFSVLAIFKRILDRVISLKEYSVPVNDFGAYMEFLWQAHDKVSDDQWVSILPDGSSFLSSYRDTIRNLKIYADSYGAEIIFVNQPYLWDEALSDKGREQIYAGFIGTDISSPETKWYTPNALRTGLSAYNDVLREECEKANLMCVDAAGQMSGNPDFFYDDFHFSEIGARYLGALVGTFLLDTVTKD